MALGSCPNLCTAAELSKHTDAMHDKVQGVGWDGMRWDRPERGNKIGKKGDEKKINLRNSVKGRKWVG